MKQFFYRILCTVALFILIPIVVTFLIQGSSAGSFPKTESLSETETKSLFDEDMLPGIIANEISMETNPEAMKAQAVIARTNCLRAIANGEELPEGLTKGEMIRLWGQENFSEYYSRLENCIEDTKGMAMTYDGSYIRADFHQCSAGYTRDAAKLYGKEEFPYLKQSDSRRDLTSKDFLKAMFYTPEEFCQKGGSLFGEKMKKIAGKKGAEEFLSRICVTEKDEAGYVTELTIDGKVHSGEEVRLIFQWNSSAFSLKAVDDQIRVVTKGFGHGLGLSLYAANCLAAEGYAYKDILKQFYAGIEFVTQYD